ncbi:hypothetical protein CJ030_MR5G021939 [Morella rubra]|uniref:Uncharacterized protein n=1 Tax=Morella rubra TaxID=262757 RepID=A0A6A1VPE5_9ROSI|nr:hypothetical protein CJ030_MR5G021939 [Morella rubra]
MTDPADLASGSGNRGKVSWRGKGRGRGKRVGRTGDKNNNEGVGRVDEVVTQESVPVVPPDFGAGVSQ